jgi:hypothetical protein
MRRRVVSLILLTVCAGAASPSAASAGDRAGRVPAGLRRDWIEWAFGSSVNPLMQKGFCGEEVGDTFFLTLTGGAPAKRVVHCDIPSGLPVLAPPGGVISWAPTDGRTDSELFETTAKQLQPIILDSVRVILDGERLRRGRLYVSDPFDLDLEPGNLIQAVDPDVTGHSTRVMFAYWFTYIPELTPGDHLLVTSDKFKGIGLFRTRFHIHVESS